jgi:hypothetical protein
MANPGKVRISLDVSPEEERKWQAAKALHGDTTLTASVRKAMKLYRLVENQKLFLQQPDGRLERLILL